MMEHPIQVTVTNVYCHGSIFRWVGHDKQGNLRHINWDTRQHGVFVDDHPDVTLPFDVLYEEGEDNNFIELL